MDQPTQSVTAQGTERPVPSDAAVRDELDRILTSADFAQSERMKAFLKFVVEETLEGRAERLKEYTIATEVFARDESFDPQTNTIVRVEAGRLRRRLERYHLTEGRDNEVRIDLPKGTYVPLFRAARPPAPAKPAAAPEAPEPGGDAAARPSGPSIAVLPFENMSGDPAQDFFADGVTEEIINDLTRFPNLKVISRHSTFKFRGRHVDVREVGRDLEVQYVLEGSVRKAGDLVRVTGQLTEAASGSHLFSETYDRDLSAQNILEIQDDIAERIVGAVGQPYGVMARAGARLLRGKAWQHLDAYDAVLRFYDYWFNASLSLHEPVRTALERAVELDPDYASAWAALASMYLDEARFGYDPRHDGDQLERALGAAQKAVLLDPENSMAYHFLFSTHFHRGELDDFRATGERALALNPNHADMLADYGIMLACCGEWERGLELTDKAMELSPTHPGWFHVAAVLDHYRKGEYEASLAEAKRVQVPDFHWGFVMVAMCCGQLGWDREGRAACDKILGLAPEIGKHMWRQLAFWNMPQDLAEHVVEGLRKAGLSIPDRPA